MKWQPILNPWHQLNNSYLESGQNIQGASVTGDELACMLKLASLCKGPRVIKDSVTEYFYRQTKCLFLFSQGPSDKEKLRTWKAVRNMKLNLQMIYTFYNRTTVNELQSLSSLPLMTLAAASFFCFAMFILICAHSGQCQEHAIIRRSGLPWRCYSLYLWISFYIIFGCPVIDWRPVRGVVRGSQPQALIFSISRNCWSI